MYKALGPSHAMLESVSGLVRALSERPQTRVQPTGKEATDSWTDMSPDGHSRRHVHKKLIKTAVVAQALNPTLRRQRQKDL